MKLLSKEALSVGGIYCVLNTPFFVVQTPIAEKASMLLFSIFIICMLLLYWPKFSLYIGDLTKRFPRIFYYLASIGWIPYFVIIGIICLIGVAAAMEWTDNTIEQAVNIFNAICIGGIPVPLGIAFIRARIKKNNQDI